MQLNDFIMNHYPNYHSSSNIAKWKELNTVLSDGGKNILEKYHLTPLDIADGTVQRMHDDLELIILKECVKNISSTQSIELTMNDDDSLPF